MPRILVLLPLVLPFLAACAPKSDSGADSNPPEPQGPTGLVVALSPAVPTVGAPLDCIVTTEAVSSDGSAVTYTYAWTQNGTASTVTDPEIPAANLVHGDVWDVTVTPTDDLGAGDVATAEATVADTAPVLDAISITPTSGYATTTFSAILGSSFDADGDAISFAYNWSADGIVIGTNPDLTGGFTRDQVIALAVVPNDGSLNGAIVDSQNTVTVTDSPPTITGVTVSPDPLYTDSVATCVPEGWTDADDDPEGYRYAWTVNGDDAGTDATLDGSLFARGDDVGCTATPFDGEQVGLPITATEVTVANSAPVLSGATLTIATPTRADSEGITLSAATDADGDYILYNYEWYVNDVDEGRSSTLSSSKFVRGDVIYADVTPWDGRDYGDPVRTDSATVANSPPSAPGISITPASPAPGDILVCSVETPSTDLDGDAITYTFGWTVNGEAYSRAKARDTDSTVSSADVGPLQVWVCSCTADDGTDSVSVSESVTVSGG